MAGDGKARWEKGKKRYEERKRRRKAAGDRFIRGDGMSRRGRWKAKEKMERGEVDLGREAAAKSENAHPLSANCCSLMDRPPLPHPAAPCCLFHLFFLPLLPTAHRIPLFIFDFTNTETQIVVICLRRKKIGAAVTQLLFKVSE